MSKVFISYDRSDKSFTLQLKTSLENLGYSIWVDFEELQPSVVWGEKIGKAIKESVAFIYLLSPESIKQGSYCRIEFNDAEKLGKKIIPVLLPSIASDRELPEEIRKYHFIKWSEFGNEPLEVSKLQTIIQTNFKWAEFHARLTSEADLWNKGGRKPLEHPLSAKEISEAKLIFSRITANDLPQPTQQIKEYVRRNDQRLRRNRSRWIISSCGVLFTVCILTSWGIYQQTQTVIQVAGRTAQAATAQAQATTAAKSLATAQVESGVAESIARRLATQASSIIRDKYDLGLLLSVEADNIYEMVDSQRSLFYAIQTNPKLSAHLQKSNQSIKALSFSSNGQDVGIVYNDGTIALWNVINRDYSTLPFVTGKSIFFSPDSKLLAIAELNSGVILWNVASKKIEQSIPDIQSEGIAMAMAGNNYLLITIDINNDVKVLNLNTNKIVTSFHTRDHPITFNRSGTLALQLTYNQKFEYEYSQWDILTGKQLGKTLQIKLTTEFASSQAVSQDGNFLFTGGCHGPFSTMIPCAEGIIEMWDSSTGKLIKQFIGHHNIIDALAIDPSLKVLASASGTNTTSDPPSIILWDIKTGEKIRTLVGHAGKISTLEFSPDGKYLISADTNGNIMLWDMARSAITTNNGEIYDVIYRADGKQLSSISCTFVIGYCETILWDFPSLEQEGVSLLSENVGGSIVTISKESAIAADYRDGIIMLWDLMSGKNIYQLSMSTSTLNMAFTPDGKYLVTVSKNNEVSLWSINNNKLILSQKLQLEKSHSNVSTEPMFDSQGKKVALIGNSTVMIVNFANGKIVYLPTTDVRYVDKMAFNPDSSLLAVSYSKGTDFQTILWDTKSGNPITGPFIDQTQSVFSSDGKYLASLDRINGIIVREVASGNIVKKIPQKAPQTITKLFFAQNNRWLITTDGNLIYLWDIESGESIGELSTGGNIRNIAFSPDGVTMAVMGCFEPTDRCTHGEATFWNLDPESWKQKACDIVGRNLTQSEWNEYIPDKNYEVTCPQYPAGN